MTTEVIYWNKIIASQSLGNDEEGVHILHPVGANVSPLYKQAHSSKSGQFVRKRR